MEFCFYPNHEHGCPHVSHCPHLGGAALGILVDAASENGLMLDMLHGQLDNARKSVSELLQENEQLKKEIEQVKLELKLERQSKFATNQQKHEETAAEEESSESSDPDSPASEQPKKKRGAPVGHPGWFRATPTEYDWDTDVPAPRRCPHCQGHVSVFASLDAVDHLQEDIIDGVYRVVCYRHQAACCDGCGAWVQQPGEAEILHSRVGPHLRSKAVYLRNVIGISYRKVPQAIEEMFGITFTPAALIGFETMLAEKAEPVVEDIGKKLASSDGPVHADETYWTLDGNRSYYWVHGDEKFIHFQFDTSRAGQVSRDILGDDFTGTLVTDCYSGYFAHVAGAKQKCLAHLARRARDWQKLTEEGSLDFAFFEDIKQFVKRACNFHRLRREGKLSDEEQAAEKAYLREELLRLETCDVNHEKAFTLQARLLRHHGEWLVFLDDPRVPPTNNLAERALRPLVVLRKITFGHRSSAGAKRMAKIMTVGETARRHGRRASDIFFKLYTRPPNRVLRDLYAAA
ncbi:MAG: IS66 family transposase [Pseudomonadales bacterium]